MPRKRYGLCCSPVVAELPCGRLQVVRFNVQWVVRPGCAQQPELRETAPAIGRCCHGCLTAIANSDSLFLLLFLVAVLHVCVRVCGVCCDSQWLRLLVVVCCCALCLVCPYGFFVDALVSCRDGCRHLAIWGV